MTLPGVFSGFLFVSGIHLGARTATDNEFTGHMDDVRIYNRALSEAEIQALAAPNRKLLIHWKTDDTGGLQATDSSGNGFHGTVEGGAVFRPTKGVLPGAIEFDGGNDCVAINDRDELDLRNAITMACWVRADSWSQGGDEGLFDKDYAFRLFCDGTTQTGMRLALSGSELQTPLPTAGACQSRALRRPRQAREDALDAQARRRHARGEGRDLLGGREMG